MYVVHCVLNQAIISCFCFSFSRSIFLSFFYSFFLSFYLSFLSFQCKTNPLQYSESDNCLIRTNTTKHGSLSRSLCLPGCSVQMEPIHTHFGMFNFTPSFSGTFITRPASEGGMYQPARVCARDISRALVFIVY